MRAGTRLLRAVGRRVGGDVPERGSSLLLVVGSGMVLTLVLLTLAGYVLNGYVQSAQRTDWLSSEQAARAGVDDYLSRLNDDDLYWTTGSTDTTNTALSQWTPVQGASNRAFFRYTLDTSSTSTDGLIRLTTSGKVGQETRSLRVTLRRANFFDYVYFSDYEVFDPAYLQFYAGGYWRNRDPATVCGVYAWNSGFDSRNPNCTKIYWKTGDAIVGKFHTNDQFAVSGAPDFQGLVSAGCPVTGSGDSCYQRNVWVAQPGVPPSPNFAAGAPTGGIVLPLPASNAALRREADPAQGGRGCLYTGPTRIVLQADGTMAVDSPNSTSTVACPLGAGVPRPANGLVFVQNLPSAQMPSDCSRPWVGTPTGVILDATSGGASYPLSADVTSYDCRAGDVFIEGTLRGQLTVATDGDAVITGNLVYANGSAGSDVLGIVAQNQVSVYHPVTSGGADLLSSAQMRDVNVQAALLSVAHSVNVQNFDKGVPRGTLRLYGSLAQKWRGAVGQFSGAVNVHGYAKDYQYDPRLKYQSPPRFLDPVSASWSPIEFGESPPAFSP